MRARLILATAIGVSAAAVAFVALRPADNDTGLDAARWTAPFDNCLLRGVGDEGDAYICIRDLVRGAASEGSIGPALAMLREAVAKDPDMLGRCHNEAHVIGEYAITTGMTLQEAYSIPWADCRFGYYHGAVAAHTAPMTLSELRDELFLLCDSFGDHTSPATMECVHVVGHFVFQRSGDDLMAASKVCEDYPEEPLESRCLDGVMMEATDSVRQLTGEDPPDPRRRAAIWGRTEEENYRAIEQVCGRPRPGPVTYVCYTNMPQALAVLWDRDFQRVGEICGTLDRLWTQPCFEGVAAAGFGIFDWDPELIAAACQETAHPGTSFCLGSMAFTFGMIDPTERADSVCGYARPHELEACLAGVQEGRKYRAATSSAVAGDRSMYGLG